MAKGSVNKCILIGRLGSDPEVKFTQGGTAVANFNLATDRSYKDKEGNWQSETDWHKIVLWARLAEVAKEYAKKGSRVYVEGRIQTRSYEDKDDQKKYVTEIVGNEFHLLDGKPEGDGGQNGLAPVEQTAPEETPDDLPF